MWTKYGFQTEHDCQIKVDSQKLLGLYQIIVTLYVYESVQNVLLDCNS